MKITWTIICIAILALFAAQDTVQAQRSVGTAFTYQGQLKEGGIPVDGVFDFVVDLYDAAVDGTRIGSVTFDGELGHDPPIAVTNGLFTVQLDFGAEAFNGEARWLELRVRLHPLLGDPHYTTLSPRQPVTATPYALYALGGPGGTGEFWAANGSDIYNTNAGRVGVGTDAPAASLQVLNTTGGHTIWAEGPNIGVLAYRRGTSGTWPAVHGECDSTSSGTSGVRGKISSETPGDLSAGVYGINSGTGENGVGVRGHHAGSGAGVYGASVGGIGVHGIATGDSGTNYGVWGETASPDGYAGYFVGGRNYFMGRVGIGAGAIIPDAMLHVVQRGTSTPALHIATRLSGDIPGYDHLTFAGTSIDAWSAPFGPGSLMLNPNVEGNVNLVSGGGTVTVGSGSTITLEQTGSGALVALKDRNGHDAVRLSTPSGSQGGGKIELKNEDGGMTVRLMGDFGGGGVLYLKQKGAVFSGITMYGGYDGGGKIDVFKGVDQEFERTITIDGDWAGRGRIRSEDLETEILYITGGSDLSERFAIRAGSDQVKPGMVVSIDPDRPGKLAVSREVYDMKVAGVISGAGGVETGLLMGQSGSVADGDHPVALTGRVYCLCDASKSPIRPGDLLTTSDTPGHAMKVTDYAKAQGAIIGKAMTSLEQGQALVLVLVSLQ